MEEIKKKRIEEGKADEKKEEIKSRKITRNPEHISQYLR
jgi:hypothetical protein